MADERTAWCLDRESAQLECGPLSATIDLLQPCLGLHNVRLEGMLLPDMQFLRMPALSSVAANPVELIEPHVRSTDLLASYAQTLKRTSSTHLRWRSLEPIESVAGFGVELAIASQTSLLDSNPALQIESQLDAETIRHLARQRDDSLTDLHLETLNRVSLSADQSAGMFVYRISGVPFDYVEIVYRADFISAEFAVDGNQSGRIAIRLRLFPERLEKGVIRFGRVRGIFLPQSSSDHAALECYEQFLNSPLPLTA